MNKRVLVAGSGGIGRAVGLLLRELGSIDVDLVLTDAHASQTESAAGFICAASEARGCVDTLTLPLDGSAPELDKALAASHIVLDCLPGSQAPRVARWALEHGLHYVNLTEYVAETKQVMALARDAQTGFALQAGLAPGFINVLGMQLFGRFCQRFGVDGADTLKMRVGALTRNAEAPHFYGFTWSPVGVATEYVKPAEVVRDFKKVECPSLEQVETLLIDDMQYEEATTSGGAADLPEALAGRVRDLDYKTLRYPGHWAWARQQLAEIGAAPDRIEQLQDRMLAQIPHLDDDVVVIYAAVEGPDRDGRRQRLDRAYRVYPETFAGRTLKAIQSTTAAGMAECARLLLTTDIRGPLLQSQLDPEDYMHGPYVSAVYGRPLSHKKL